MLNNQMVYPSMILHGNQFHPGIHDSSLFTDGRFFRFFRWALALGLSSNKTHTLPELSTVFPQCSSGTAVRSRMSWPVLHDMAVCENRVPLVNIKIAGKWMFIPLKMVLIGIDPYPYVIMLPNPVAVLIRNARKQFKRRPLSAVTWATSAEQPPHHFR